MVILKWGKFKLFCWHDRSHSREFYADKGSLLQQKARNLESDESDGFLTALVVFPEDLLFCCDCTTSSLGQHSHSGWWRTCYILALQVVAMSIQWPAVISSTPALLIKLLISVSVWTLLWRTWLCRDIQFAQYCEILFSLHNSADKSLEEVKPSTCMLYPCLPWLVKGCLVEWLKTFCIQRSEKLLREEFPSSS